MLKFIAISLLVVICLRPAAPAFAAEKDLSMVHVPDTSKILSTLHHVHPRLLADGKTFDRLAELIKTDKLVAAWYQHVHEQADKLLDEPVNTYHLPDGRRLLSISRNVLNRTMTLGLVWRIERDDKYADRLWKEMQAVCAFQDWHPPHFLDTGEMTAAVGIAYDWLFDHWTAEQRATMRDAIVKLGLTPAKDGYEQGSWWTKTHINWNLVCNGGIGMGALAIADEQPELAAQIIHNAAEGVPNALVAYGPDGAWSEGPGYWNYATMYATMFLSSIKCSLGADFGLSDIPGLNLAGDMPLYFTTPSGLSFNFSDAHERATDGPALFWLAKRFNSPRFALHRMKLLATRAKAGPMDLLWFDPAWEKLTQDDLPTAHYFRGTEVASMRSAWTDDATFVGLKAGSNGSGGHAHLDLGSFILEATGQRFAIDIGSDDYNLPGYFGGNKRWVYYRVRAEGHNTLVINPDKQPDQNPQAATTISDFKSADGKTSATIDLTPAYASHGAEHVQRSVVLDGKAVTIRDEVKLKAPGDIWWFWHTRAAVRITDGGRSATLTQQDKQLTVRLQSPEGAKFIVMDAAPLPTSPNPEGQNPNNGAKLTNASRGVSQVAIGTTPKFGPPDPAHAIRKLAIHLSGTRQATIIVTAQPAAQ